MVELTDLWLPVLLAAVFVFIASSVIHMATPWHKGDYKKLPNEERAMDELRAHAIPPGTYMFPCAGSLQEAGTPEFIAKMEKGPVGFVTMLPTRPINMGKNLLQWFLFTIFVGLVAAYVASVTLPAGADGTTVQRVVCSVAFMAYGVTNVGDSIWKGVSWLITAKFVVDGAIYAFVTALTFQWLWPAAV